jgi:hypothetical protein
MKALSQRAQLMLVAAGYAAVAAMSVFLVAWRYLQYKLHPDDANLYGGMWAGGDMMLAVFIFCLLMVPTFFLALVIRKSELLYTRYAKVLVGVGASAPISLGVIAIPAVGQGNGWLGWVFFWRVLGSPLVFLAMTGSRLLARFPRAKRLCNYALLIEGLTLVAMVFLFGRH